jgi:protein gp37
LIDMSDNSKIEWTDTTWNPVVGCSHAGSPGCDNCYAARMASRGLAKSHAGLAAGGKWNGEVRLLEDRLCLPRKWRKPRKIFVCSMGDLFHPAVPFEFIDKAFAVMALWPGHTFQVLTKRPARMAEYFAHDGPNFTDTYHNIGRAISAANGATIPAQLSAEHWGFILPLPNVWLGTSVENQQAADGRIPHLLRCPAAVRFVSCEPLLGPVDLTPPENRGTNWNLDDWLQELDWVVVGGESGPGARPMHPDWARTIRDRCDGRTDMGRPWPLPFFFKQWGGVNKKAAGHLLDGVEHREFPITETQTTGETL